MALYLSENDVKSLLTVDMAIEGVESAHRDLALGCALDTSRARTRLPQTALHILQGGLPAQGVVGFKAYTSNRSGNRFSVHLYDSASGELKAIIAADYLGMMRTGAASAVATRSLANANARVAGILGAGWQAEGHILALCRVTTLEHIKVFSRRKDRLASFCARMSEQCGVPVLASGSPEEVVREADVLGTVTTAAQPLFEADWLKPGVHINAAGSNALVRRELSESAIRCCDLIAVDSVPTALAESGDLLPVLEKGRMHSRQLIELGDILVGHRQGRIAPTQRTLFESQGLAIQDLAVAERVFKAAEVLGVGLQLPF